MRFEFVEFLDRFLLTFAFTGFRRRECLESPLCGSANVFVANIIAQALTDTHIRLQIAPSVLIRRKLVPIHGGRCCCLLERSTTEFVLIHIVDQFGNTYMCSGTVDQRKFRMCLIHDFAIDRIVVLLRIVMDRS